MLLAPPGHAAEVMGMDHIPIAVRDLGAAIRSYEHLGFALKQGRYHADGVSNGHIKFPDGTELELISAVEAVDDLTAEYRQFLERGEGPAFLGFFAPRRNDLIDRLSAGFASADFSSSWIRFPQSDPLHYIFFGQRNASATDRPEHFAHPNGAQSLIGVWLAGDDFSREQELFRSLGATSSTERACTPECARQARWRFAESEITLLPSSRGLSTSRKIVGAVVRVRSIRATKAFLQGVVPTLTEAHGEHWDSIFIPPDVTHGIWLELRETH